MVISSCRELLSLFSAPSSKSSSFSPDVGAKFISPAKLQSLQADQANKIRLYVWTRRESQVKMA